MENSFPRQSKPSKETLLAKCKEEGLPMEYANVFWDNYCIIYDELAGEENCLEEAFKQNKDGMNWYILYSQIGHPELWCQVAWDVGRLEPNLELTIETDAECLKRAYELHWKESPEEAKRELDRHCAFVAKTFNKSPIFMRFFREWNEGLSGGSGMLSYFDEMEISYNDAIAKGKDGDFAYYYATGEGDSSANWRMAETREKLINLGWDEDYIREYLKRYQEGLGDDGAERDHPDIPAFWEEKVSAYMNGWDYARRNNLDNDFVATYQNVYLNALHADNPEVIPWDRFDAFVLDIALRRHKGEDAEIEPYDPELIEERIRSYRATESKRRPGYSLNDEMWDIMYPNGMDDD